MKGWMKILLGISLSLMCIFTSIGYARLSTDLTVEGDIELAPPNAIFILDISNVHTTGATVTTSPMNIGYPSTKVLSEIVFSGRNSSVTFDVSVMNGTEFNQYFDVLEEYAELEGIDGSFSYASIDWNTSISQGTPIAPGEVQTFTVTLTYTGRNTNQTRKMLHEIDFVLNSDDLTEAVSKDVTDKFKDILNNHLEEDISYTYNGTTIKVDKDTTYQEIINHMESDRTGNYIGNLVGSDADDKALLTALFEGNLMFSVGTEEIPITVMIKNKNVFGTSESEMVLYITADDLSSSRSYVPVYASVYSKNSDGEWVQAGEIYAGEARVNGYSGSYFGNGSFDTESWRSTQAYYGVSSGSNIGAVLNGYINQQS